MGYSLYPSNKLEGEKTMAEYVAVYDAVYLELPFELSRLMRLEIKQQLNEHAVAQFTALLNADQDLEMIHALNESTNVKVKVKEEDKEKVIFSGIPIDVKIQCISQQYQIQMTLYSYSIYLDFEYRKRSFQNKDNPYANLLKKVTASYDADLLDSVTKDAIQKAPIIQYEETDWEFLKRIASHFGTIIYPDVQGEKPQVYIGLHESKCYTEENYEYALQKKIKEYMLFKQRHKDVNELDYILCDVESIKQYELGEQIIYQGITFRVSEKYSVFEQGVFKQRYTLQREKALRQSKRYNDKLKGISIEGKVLAVRQDRIRVHLSIDNEQKEEEAYWYVFGTPYTSEGQTGWYIMPEVGTSVQLYMPTQDEASGYMMGVNRLDGEENPKVQNPNHKYLGTIDGKEMKLTPEGITFTATQGSLYMELDEQDGITMNSSTDIKLYTEKDIYSESQTMSLRAEDRIVLKTNQTSIVIDDLIQMRC